MSERRKFLMSMSAVPLLLSGCKVRTINYFPPTPANVRVLNLMLPAPLINVAVNGNAAFANVPYPAVSTYQSFDNQSTPFVVSVPGSASSLLSFDFLLAGEVYYALVTMGTLAQPSAGMMQEVSTLPTGNIFLLATFNADFTYSTLDVYLTAPGIDINTVGASFTVGYNSTTRFLSQTAGAYQIRVTQQGTKTVVYDSGPLPIAAGSASVFTCYSTGSNLLVNAGFLQAKGSWDIADNTLSRIKVVNAAPGIGAVNLLQNGSALVSNLGYAGASSFPPGTTSYSIVPAGANALVFEASATPGAPIASTTATLAPGADQTVYVTGLPGANQAIVLRDVNQPPFGANVRVRFVNASPDAGPVNVLVDGNVQASALAPQTASAYVEIGNGTYAITFVSVSTGATLLTLPAAALTTGGTFSVFAIGQAVAMTGLVTQDV